MSKFNTVSFDAADTLFFIKEGLGNTYCNVLKKYSSSYDPSDISRCFKKHFSSRKGLHFDCLKGDDLFKAEKQWWHSLVRDIFLQLGMFKDFDDYFDDLYDYFSLDAWQIYPDTIPTLKKLKDMNFKITITSNFDSRIYKVCDHFQINKYIDSFTISSEAGYSKPDKKLFFKSLDRIGSVPLESLHVGDDYELDYVPSNEIGMKSLLINRDEIKNYNPDITTISSLESITEYLNER